MLFNSLASNIDWISFEFCELFFQVLIFWFSNDWALFKIVVFCKFSLSKYSLIIS